PSNGRRHPGGLRCADRPRGSRGTSVLRRTPNAGQPRLFPTLEYAFKHALTHEVAYGSLLREQRRALHVRIVQAIALARAGRGGKGGSRVSRWLARELMSG